jgi:hypothetical protein
MRPLLAGSPLAVLGPILLDLGFDLVFADEGGRDLAIA